MSDAELESPVTLSGVNQAAKRKKTPLQRGLQILSLGSIASGCLIIFVAISFLTQSTQPYRENLHALKNTIQEVNRTLAQVRTQTVQFRDYLDVLRKGVNQTGADIRALEKVGNNFIGVTGNSSAQVLAEAAKIVTEAGAVLKATADQAGGVPFDLMNAQRQSLYAMVGNCTTIAATLKVTANEVNKSANDVKAVTTSTLATARTTLRSTDQQLAMLRSGSIEHLPGTLEALSVQLTAHVQMIDASYDLLNKIGIVIIAVGLGFGCSGLAGFLRATFL